MAVATYSREQANLMVAGINITFESFTVSRNTEDWAYSVDADGIVGRSRMSDQTVTITIEVADQNFASNAALEAIRVADAVSLTALVPFQYDDLGQDVSFAGKCWITKPPDMTKQAEMGTKTWVLIGDLGVILNLGFPAE